MDEGNAGSKWDEADDDAWIDCYVACFVIASVAFVIGRYL